MKNLIREELKKKINNLSSEEVISKSNIIKDKVIEITDCQSIMIYVSKNKEVQTHDLIKYFLDKKKIVIVPYTKENNIFPSEINNFKDLQIGQFDILEPKVKDKYKGKIDQVIVPGICFDKSGNRIGRGLGYYDRFLKDIKAEIIALAYDFQIVDKIVPDENDIKVQKIITESRIINY